MLRERHEETKPVKREAEAPAPLFEWPLPAFSPFMRRFFDDWERLFEGMWRGGPSAPWRFAGLERPETIAWVPSVEIAEREGRFVVKAELPGLTKEDVKIELTDEMLVISGEKKLEKELKEKGGYRTELSYGSFYRAIPLPEGVEIDKAKATFANGTLEIMMPAPVKAKPRARKVEIEEVKARTAA